MNRKIIKLDKRYKNIIVEIYENKEDDSPQVIVFEGDSVIETKYQTNGRELNIDYAEIEKEIENENGKKILVIRVFKQ